MKRRCLLVLAGLILVSGFFSCESIFNCPECFTPPAPLVLKVSSSFDSTDLIYNGFYQADSILIYYFDGNSKKLVDVEVYSDSVKETSVIVSNEISWISSGGEKTFFVYLNNFDTDTIYLDVREANDDCCTYFEWLCFEINGNIVEPDNTNYWYNYLK
jgi:hypothetical protein